MAKANAARKKGNMLGGWAFLLGVVIAVLVGLSTQVNLITLTPTVVLVLAVLGLLVGLLAVGAKDEEPFVHASAVILIAALVGKEVLAGASYLNLGDLLTAVVALMAPAAVLISLREAFGIVRK